MLALSIQVPQLGGFPNLPRVLSFLENQEGSSHFAYLTTASVSPCE